MDLDLLHSFVSVVDTGGFTRAGERVHRTQSTVSQQIRKLEAGLGCELFLREGRQLRLTEDGERLLGYARRMLALSTEIREVVSGAQRVEVLRLGVPDDFSVQRLTAMVADFARSHPGLRISMRCDLSMALHRAMERGELDVALLKRDPGLPGAQAVWPERLVWLCGPSMPPELPDPVPLVLFPQGCLYRNRAIHALESAGRRWRIAYESANVNGLLAALEGGLGLGLMERRCMTPGLRVAPWTLPAASSSELALCLRASAGAGARLLADAVRAFCDDPRAWQPELLQAA
ncbi:LysR substrate-binding domain-containing protein [Bordetella hinzii]|uniref:LysR family transcriptional regulator n=1 Tax=Bordetella hinzii TaxID=103855 RepID=UPI002A18A958|nr:LysR substrate-binding domain-containing protein [Bordetella hinzii]WPL82716.1 LysR substrate-binding domain-containing protein [Bordetella hinzii]